MADLGDTSCDYPSAGYHGEADSLLSQPSGGNVEQSNEPRPLDDDELVDLPGDWNGNRTPGDLAGQYHDDSHLLGSRTDSRVSEPMTNTPERPQEAMNFSIHFPDDLEAESLTKFSNLLENCKKEVRERIAAWREITSPIARELSSPPLWKAEDDPFFQAAERVDNMILNVSGMGDEVGDNLDRLSSKVRPRWVVDLIEAGRTKELPPVDPDAWKCLFWFWGCYRKACKAWIDVFQAILQDWDTWTWTTSLSKAEALRLIGFLVTRREEANPRLSGDNWMAAFAESNPLAHHWFQLPTDDE